MSTRVIPATLIAISTLSLSGVVANSAFGQAAAQAVPAEADFAPKDMNINVGGSLLLPDGKPASGASLYVSWLDKSFQPQYRKIDVSANGRFHWQAALKQVPKQISGIALIASAPDGGSLFQSIPWSDTKKQSLSFKLESAATVSGRLIGQDNRALPGVKLTVKSIQREPADRFSVEPTRQSVFTLLRSMPSKLIKSGQSAVTDKEGQFQITGVPRGTVVRISPSSEYVFAAGSRTPVPVSGKVARAGILVAAKPGSLEISLTDAVTGKPVPSAHVTVLPASALQNLFLQSFAGDGDASENPMMATEVSDEKGQITADRLAPGDYSVEISGYEKTVTVHPGVKETVSLQVRNGVLSGKVLDADGKPFANAPIFMEVVAGSSSSRRLSQEMAFGGGANPRAQVQSGQDGKFEFPTFPWGVKEVTLRSSRGNEEAEWKGNPATINGPLVLRLKKGALVTVKGRMVDPSYKPLGERNVSVIRWRDDQPRLTWMLSAKQAKVDKAGQFAIDGLRRGESFSILSGSPFEGSMQSEQKGFESPRFEVVASAGTGQQELGDVVVHPLSGGDQILQVYGFESREQLARLSSLMTPPPAAEVDAARRVLANYANAIERGDVAGVQQATSRLSPGWTSDLTSFARSTRLRSCSAEEIASAQPLRFIPRISLAYVLSIGRAQGPFDLNFGASARELDENPDWVLFVSPQVSPKSLALLRRERGEWRVVNLASFPGGFEEQVLLGPGTQLRDTAELRKPSARLSEAERKNVESVAKEYLAAWKQESAVRLQQLTSPFSTTWGRTPEAMLAAFENRPDEGRCPSRKVDSGIKIVDDLSTWETAWLTSYAGSIQQFSGGRSNSPRVPAAMQTGFPNAYAARGDVAVVRYEATEGDYLMVLVKFAGDWRVMEAAIPL